MFMKIFIQGGLISLWLYKEKRNYGIENKYIYSTYSPWAPHTYDFVVLTSLSHPRKIVLFVLQRGKYEIREGKNLSAPLRIIVCWSMYIVYICCIAVIITLWIRGAEPLVLNEIPFSEVLWGLSHLFLNIRIKKTYRFRSQCTVTEYYQFKLITNDFWEWKG
jgi:hypothetical protein